MTAVHFALDTLKFVETMIAAGMPESQAKALSKLQKEDFEEAVEKTLATKIDIANLNAETKIEFTTVRAEIQILKNELLTEIKVGDADLKSYIKILQWMMGFVLAGIGALMLKAFF